MVNRKAFTMIELVFVIVVLGILASIAIPRLSATREDANIAKAKATIVSIKQGINIKRSEKILGGNFSYPDELNNTTNIGFNVLLFGEVLREPIFSRDNGSTGWNREVNTTERYRYNLAGVNVAIFEYNSTTGDFNCTGGIDYNYCEILLR